MPPKKGSKAAAAAAAKTSATTKPAAKGPTGPNTVISLAFPSMDIMAIGLGRISAYLEDPKLEGKPVSFRTLIDANSPCIRYAGHNFSLQHYNDACNALKDLSVAEKTVQRSILEVARKVKPPATVYIIAHVSGDTKTLEHEEKHAMFHFCADYRARVAGLWAGVEAGNPSWAAQFNAHLGGLYCERVWLDEFQAIVLNREYECAAKTVSLLQSIVPAVASLPYHFESVALPTKGLEPAAAEAAFCRGGGGSGGNGDDNDDDCSIDCGKEQKQRTQETETVVVVVADDKSDCEHGSKDASDKAVADLTKKLAKAFK